MQSRMDPGVKPGLAWNVPELRTQRWGSLKTEDSTWPLPTEKPIWEHETIPVKPFFLPPSQEG